MPLNSLLETTMDNAIPFAISEFAFFAANVPNDVFFIYVL